MLHILPLRYMIDMVSYLNLQRRLPNSIIKCSPSIPKLLGVRAQDAWMEGMLYTPGLYYNITSSRPGGRTDLAHQQVLKALSHHQYSGFSSYAIFGDVFSLSFGKQCNGNRMVKQNAMMRSGAFVNHVSRCDADGAGDQMAMATDGTAGRVYC